MADFEQPFCGLTRYVAGTVNDAMTVNACTVMIDGGIFTVTDPSGDDRIRMPVSSVRFKRTAVQGRFGSIAIWTADDKYLISFGKVRRAETGRAFGAVRHARTLGERFEQALRAAGAQPQ